MSQEQKTPEQLLADYETYLDMFSTDGWKKFIEVNTEQLAREKKTAHITKVTNDTWQEFRGYASLMEQILSFEENIGNQIDLLKEEIAEPEAEDTSDFNT